MVQELDWEHLGRRSKSRVSRPVRGFKRIDQDLSYLPNNPKIPILFRAARPSILTESNLVSNRQQSMLSLADACYVLAEQIGLLKKNASKLSEIDSLTEKVTKPLETCCKAILFELIDNGSSLQHNNEINSLLSVNLSTVLKITKYISERVPQEALKNTLGLALTTFLCHEISHVSQGIKHYESVRRMKSVDEIHGRKRLGELDLRSDFLAAHTLSYCLALKGKNFPSQDKYIKNLYTIWCTVCRLMIDVFPSCERVDKQQRVFGYLLMSNCIRHAYESDHPLEFKAELWPDWNSSLDKLAFYSGGNLIYPGSPVDPSVMHQVLDDISQGRYDRAGDGIEIIWKHYPRR